MKTKTGRRFLSAIIALVMLLGTGTISFSTLAADGETVTDGDITYVISNGCITDVTVKDDAILENYTVPAKVGNISINSIGVGAFSGTKITTLTIPETVTLIKGGAFYDCGISKVIFNAPYCEMNKSTNAYTNQSFFSINPVFFGNAELTEFEFGSKVGSIPAYVCTNISSLETVKFNKTVSEIGECAFYGCSALNNIDLSNLTVIGNTAFYGCNSLDIIELPQVKNIGEKAFMNCGFPSKVSFPKVATIGACAFAHTSMDIVTIPETVTSIDGGAFYDCGISKVFFNAPVCDVYTSTDAYTDKSFLHLNPAFFGNASLKEFEFGSKVGSVPAYVCTNVSSLETVKFNKTVSKIGECAFYGCNSLDIIELPQVTDIGEKAFMNCGTPSKVSFPKAEKIGDCAFAQTVMDTVTIPETVTSIGGGAFNYCNISKVVFNAPVCDLKESTSTCTEAGRLNYNPAFFGNASLTEIEFGSKVGSVPAYVCTNVSSLETVKFNKTVSKIGECAFYGCSALNNIDLSNLTVIGNDALNSCNSLDIIELPQVTDIGEKAFMNCGSPSKVSFPKVATIGDCAFAQTVMDTVTIPETVTSIGGGAFNYCNISKVIFNAPVCDLKESTSTYTEAGRLMYNPAFFGNASLTEIEFGTNVESIPANVCTNVYALQKVSFRAAVTEIGNDAFYGCQTPDEIIYAGTKDQWNALKDKSEKTGNDSLFKCTNIKYTVNPITEYTVTFNANGGDVTPEAQKVEENATIILPDSTKANFTFLGWSLDKNATTATYLAGSTYKVTGNVTLYAVWEAIDEPAEKTFTDSASDVQVTDNNNAFGGKDVKINVEVTSSDAELDKKIHDFALTKASEIYNISFTYNGEEIQPNGMVKVRIPYDKEIKDPSKIKVFHYHENSNGEMVFSKISNVTILPGYIEFETDSFSKFVVAEEITISINGNSKMQYKGTQTLKVETNGEVEFTSSNPKVVSVDENGKVTATGKGTATITATVKGTDVSTSINITVSYTWWQWIIRIVLFGWIWY